MRQTRQFFLETSRLPGFFFQVFFESFQVVQIPKNSAAPPVGHTSLYRTFRTDASGQRPWLLTCFRTTQVRGCCFLRRGSLSVLTPLAPGSLDYTCLDLTAKGRWQQPDHASITDCTTQDAPRWLFGSHLLRRRREAEAERERRVFFGKAFENRSRSSILIVRYQRNTCPPDRAILPRLSVTPADSALSRPLWYLLCKVKLD